MKKAVLILMTLFQSLSMNGQQLIIKPSFETGNDSYVWSGGQTSNYSENQSIFSYTWTNGGNTTNIRGLIKFDLNQIPEGSIIQNAYLSLYWNPSETTNGVSEHSGQNAFWIERVISPWHENIVTWESQPQTTQQNRISVPQSNSGNQDYLDIEITDLINDMVANPNESYGFVIKMQDESTPYKNVVFASSENSNENIKPTITINYTAQDENCLKIRPNSVEGQDSYIWDNGVSNNYGDNQSIHSYTWTNGGNTSIIRGLLNFDLGNIPNGVIVESAKMSLFYNPNSTLSGVNIHSGDNKFWIERIISPWNENTLNWSNQPSTTIENRVNVEQSAFDNQDYIDIDVTNLLADILDNPSEGFGFMLKMQDENTPYNNVVFASSNHPNSSLHPLLEVCYSIVSSSENLKSENSIKMFPNPVQEIIHFQNISERYTQLIIRNINGSILESKTLSNIESAVSVDIRHLPSGMYFVEFNSEQKGIKTFKLVKN